MSENKRWYSWVIRRNSIEHVVKYIKDNCPEIDKFFYPQIKKEYQTKKGIKVKDRPLYEGYLFLRYDNSAVVFHKLSSYPFVTTFAGTVEDEEIERMQEVQGKLFSELKASKFKEGESVTLLEGPFKGFEARVVAVEGNAIRVRVDARLLGQQGIDMAYSEEQLERKTELQDMKVQDIK